MPKKWNSSCRPFALLQGSGVQPVLTAAWLPSWKPCLYLACTTVKKHPCQMLAEVFDLPGVFLLLLASGSSFCKESISTWHLVEGNKGSRVAFDLVCLPSF